MVLGSREGLRLLVEPDVFHACTVGDAVDHDCQPLHLAPPASRARRVTYNRPNVTLIDVSGEPIEVITPAGIRAKSREYAVNAIVSATGFDAMTGGAAWNADSTCFSDVLFIRYLPVARVCGAMSLRWATYSEGILSGI